ncbi:hypothetical protein FB45DRAFT_902568 [Roridomyces roridus]|uniref:Uncharacterized protein n=1 Tax=Roridomyces roridus TaxID=1738132 RepID=A0AAD7C435_9AGAR|nr:hypothetical protein FB45DRAFT_902568 [Roridomyces roridus]
MLTDVLLYIHTPPTTMIDDKVASQPPAYDPALESNAAPVAPAPLLTEAEWNAKTAPLLTDAEWNAKLAKLQRKVRKYNWTKKRGDEAAIVSGMRDLAASHYDPAVKAYWTQRAEAFEKAPDTDKMGILRDIGLGLALIIAAPLTLAGALLMGTGMLVKASGEFVAGGKFRLR